MNLYQATFRSETGHVYATFVHASSIKAARRLAVLLEEEWNDVPAVLIGLRSHDGHR